MGTYDPETRKKAKNILTALIVATLVGVLIGRATSGNLVASNEYKEKYENLYKKLDHLNQVDFEEYLALKDQKAKYDKADEILGKMVLIFLADLGLNVSKDKMLLAKKMARAVGHEPEATIDTAALSAQVFSENPKPVKKEPSPPVGSLRYKEKALDDITTEEQVKKFLGDVTVDNFFEIMKTAHRMNSEQLQLMNGFFIGKVNFEDKSDPWDVEMNLDGVQKGDDISANVDIKMFKIGESKPFSHASGNGDDIKQYQGVEDSQAIIVDVYGGDGYFQLYAPKKTNTIVGNYYHKKGAGKFAKTGTVTLQRR